MASLRFTVAVITLLNTTCLMAQTRVATSATDAELPPPLPNSPETPISNHPAERSDPPEQTSDAVTEPSPLVSWDGYSYRVKESGMSWMAGDGDQFGMFSLVSSHYESPGANAGLSVGYGFHFVGGPERTDMPPRLYDFSLGYQRRDFLTPLETFGYDVAFAIKASSDFEGSSRKGIRFPAHAVGYLALDQCTSTYLVFGADYLDRDDVRLLPVAGLVTSPFSDVRLELVFPRPRLEYQVSENQQLFLRGGLGGGTWAIERDTLEDDLATYRDLQIGVGLAHEGADGGHTMFEITYLFDRKLEFASRVGNYRPDGTVMLRLISSY